MSSGFTLTLELLQKTRVALAQTAGVGHASQCVTVLNNVLIALYYLSVFSMDDEGLEEMPQGSSLHIPTNFFFFF